MSMDDSPEAIEGTLGRRGYTETRNAGSFDWDQTAGAIDKVISLTDQHYASRVDLQDLERAHTMLANRVNEIQGHVNRLQAQAQTERCEKCGSSPARYWFGPRKILCRSCVERKPEVAPRTTWTWRDWVELSLVMVGGAVLTALATIGVRHAICAF